MPDYLEQGQRALKGGDFKTAFIQFREAVKAEPDRAETWYWLSVVLPELQQRRECLERCLKLQPDHAPAQTALAQLLSQPSIPISEAPIEVVDSSTSSHDERLEELAALEAAPISSSKNKTKKISKEKGRRFQQSWLWVFILGFFLLVLGVGLVWITYLSLPRYEALAPVIASLAPQQPGANAPSATTNPISVVIPTPAPPIYYPEQWKAVSIAYERSDNSDGWSDLVIELAIENHSSSFGVVQIQKEAILQPEQGASIAYPLDYTSSILPGLRLRSSDQGLPFSLHYRVPADQEDFRLRIPYQIELINLENTGRTQAEGVFELDPSQTLSQPATMFLIGNFQSFQQDPPLGVRAGSLGEPLDFVLGNWSFASFRIEPPSPEPDTIPTYVLSAEIINKIVENQLNLDPLADKSIQIYRDTDWGQIIRPKTSVETLVIEPESMLNIEIWSLPVEDVLVEWPETWCAIGIYQISNGDLRPYLGVLSCFPVNPP